MSIDRNYDLQHINLRTRIGRRASVEHVVHQVDQVANIRTGTIVVDVSADVAARTGRG